MYEDQIVESVSIDADPERVWQLLTDPEYLPQWWDSLVSVAGEVKEGSMLVLDFGEHGRTNAVVETLDRPHAFAWRWASDYEQPVEAGTSTLVEFRLEAEGAGTFVQVTESGFAALDGGDEKKQELFEDRSGGWPTVMEWLSGSRLLSS